ncbi:YpoC family protein [Staphylococcus durrellii]|uniref:YpoC family protein n=1 Tax=Staphylococcus durrellii TaxID=2781773 RepID=UPI0018A10AB8|nr:hypothetical protein [Staphylococcus durrellii]MBF7017100.1 hypothetical protein [Staphylococcus durrellii]
MITKDDFNNLETKLDFYAQKKQLKSATAKTYLDNYFDLIINYFKQINSIQTINLNELEQLPVVPMNFRERYQYMQQRKYHFMGYRQMKTLKSELIKMNASYQIRQKNSGLNN